MRKKESRYSKEFKSNIKTIIRRINGNSHGYLFSTEIEILHEVLNINIDNGLSCLEEFAIRIILNTVSNDIVFKSDKILNNSIIRIASML